MDQITHNARRLLQLLDRMRRQPASAGFLQLSEMGLSFSHVRVLRLLMHHQPLAMKELAERLRLTPPSVTALTRRLSQTGMVARHHHAGDSRIVLLSLTDAGQNLHQRLHEEHLQRMEALLSGLSPEEQEQFLDLLDRATSALTDGCFDHSDRPEPAADDTP